MQQRYQYSSLFTAGLLMQPRPVHSGLVLDTEQVSSTPFPTENGTRKQVEPLVISIPSQVSSPRRTSRRRRSSVTLHLSPVSGARLCTRAVEDAWERSKRNTNAMSRGGYPATSLREQSLVASVDENDDLDAKLGDAEQITPTKFTYASKTQPMLTKKQSATLLQPKPVPTTPLPALPIDIDQLRAGDEVWL